MARVGGTGKDLLDLSRKDTLSRYPVASLPDACSTLRTHHTINDVEESRFLLNGKSRYCEPECHPPRGNIRGPTTFLDALACALICKIV